MASPEVENDPSDALSEIAASFRTSRQTIEEMTVNFVREAILSGIYRPGQRLQQESISELLGVSRMPVRAALKKLETEGLVLFSAHRGATVRMLSADEIAEIYELRIMLESHLLELAMQRLTPEVLKELERSAEQVRRQTDSSRWIGQRQVFYQKLYELAGRPKTTALVAELRAEVGPYLVLRRVAESPETHLGVLEHLKRGDLEGAKRWLADHLATVSERLQQLIREEAGAADDEGRATGRRGRGGSGTGGTGGTGGAVS